MRISITGEDEEDDTKLKYLTYLRDIRDNKPDLFERIKHLPKKARTAREYNEEYNSVITFFRKGKLRKIFKTKNGIAEEVDFCRGAEILKADENTKKEKLDAEFYKHLESNKEEFNNVFKTDDMEHSGGGGHESKLIKILKAIEKTKEFTEEDGEYIHKVMDLLKRGLPKRTIKGIMEEIENEINPHKILTKIKLKITPDFFRETYAANAADTSGPKEVILSEYLKSNKHG